MSRFLRRVTLLESACASPFIGVTSLIHVLILDDFKLRAQASLVNVRERLGSGKRANGPAVSSRLRVRSLCHYEFARRFSCGFPR